MVEITNVIPRKEATMIEVPKTRPELIGVPGMERIEYNSLIIPEGLNRNFLDRCGVSVQNASRGISPETVKTLIYAKNIETDMFVRYAGEKPLSIVTDKFSPIDPVDLVSQVTAATGTTPTMRYFRGNESLHLNFPLKTERFEGINLFVSTGPYGVYGGSGQNALTYGLSWYNKTCSNWTLFLKKSLNQSVGRVTHMNRNKSLGDKLNDLIDFTRVLPTKIEKSKSKIFSYDEMNTYFSMYEKRGLNKGITKVIREENPAGITSYDLSYRLTQLCQNPELADSTRARIEYIAGEVILCYDAIKSKLSGELGTANKRSRETKDFHYNGLPLNYVRLN